MMTSSIWDKMHSIQYYVRTVKLDIDDRNSNEMIDANRKKKQKKTSKYQQLTSYVNIFIFER